MSAVPAFRDTKYEELKDYVVESTGLAYYQSRDKDFEERIDRRLRLLGLTSYRSYLELLHDSKQGEAELDHLIAELTIGETFFFRDEQQFEVLRHLILPDLLRRNRLQKTLRVWSAGCASGAEVYSLSIVLRDELGAQTGGWDVSILGTDVNRRLLAQAQEGIYEKWALRSTPDEIRERCFQQAGNHWRLADRYREGVGFQYHNLVKHQTPSWLNSLFVFDLIFCRNVMIYFDRPTAASVVERLRDCLTAGSWLVVGHADHQPDAFRTFDVVSRNGISVYRKRGGTSTEAARPAAAAELAKDAPDSSGVASFAGPPPWAIGPEPGVPNFLPNPAKDATATTPGDRVESGAPNLTEVRTLADAGAWVKAEALCAVLIERSPLDPAPHFYHALILEQMGRLDEAERSLRRAVYLDRRFVLAHYHLGLLLRRDGGQPRAARQSFGNVLALLAGMDDAHMFEHGDGILAADLRALTEMNLEGL